MKFGKRIAVVICLLCFLLTGCSNQFAKMQYDSVKDIAKREDRYAKSSSCLNYVDDNVTLTVGKFDGRETILSLTCSEDEEVEINLTFTISAGKAKLVLVDEEGNASTIAECTKDSMIEEKTTYTISLKKGIHKFKIVGYDCKDIDLNMEVEGWNNA